MSGITLLDQILFFGVMVVGSLILGSVAHRGARAASNVTVDFGEGTAYWWTYIGISLGSASLAGGLGAIIVNTYFASIPWIRLALFGIAIPYILPTLSYWFGPRIRAWQSKVNETRKSREEEKNQEQVSQVQDVLIEGAESNGGMLTKDEVQEITDGYSRKQVLTALNQLKCDGLMEQQSGVYVFPELTNI